MTNGLSSIRYQVTHRTLYRYSDDVTSSYGRGYLTPRDTDWQHCESSELIVEPEPSDRSTGRDLYGNLSSYFHVTTPHRELSVTARSIVDVENLVPSGAGWEQPWGAGPAGVPGFDRRGALATEFVLDLVPPEITDDVRDYAAVSFTPGRPLGEAVVDLMGRIYRDFEYRSGSTTISTKVSEVLAAREVSVRTSPASPRPRCARRDWLPATYRVTWQRILRPGSLAWSDRMPPTPGRRFGCHPTAGLPSTRRTTRLPTNGMSPSRGAATTRTFRPCAASSTPIPTAAASRCRWTSHPVRRVLRMRDFICPQCGQHLAFENSVCLSCGSHLGFSLDQKALLVLAADAAPGFVDADDHQLCANLHVAECNWLVSGAAAGALCASCALTRTRPNDADTAALPAFAEAEGQSAGSSPSLPSCGCR